MQGINLFLIYKSYFIQRQDVEKVFLKLQIKSMKKDSCKIWFSIGKVNKFLLSFKYAKQQKLMLVRAEKCILNYLHFIFKYST